MIDWDKIESFAGFGRIDAPVVFLGLEEGLRRDADLFEDLKARSAYGTTMDLAAAQQNLDGPGAYFGDQPITQKTWRPMCHLMLRREGVSSPTLEQRLRYQADHLGRTGGDTLLVELLPYPHSDSGQWLYESFGIFPTRAAYITAIAPKRQEMLRGIFATRPPELIVAYTKQNWDYYREIFPGVTWTIDGKFEYGTWRDTRIVLAHGFAGKQFNTDEQLNRFADVCLRDRPVVKRPSPVALVPASRHTANRRANLHFRQAFGALASSHRLASGLSRNEVSELAKFGEKRQGNPQGVADLELGRGWVHPTFATGVFRAIGVPSADEVGAAYESLKEALGGTTREVDEF